MHSTQFSSLTLASDLLTNLSSLGYKEMTPIQAQSLPSIVEGKDVIGQAKTGSGKTAAFALGLLNNLNVKRFRVQSLVLCPTRELADQVAKEIRRLARATHNIKVLLLCGGMPMGPQIGSLEHGAHIIVGTPGRIHDHLSKHRLDLSEVNTLVLDEADRMLEMGFQEALDNVLAECPEQRQTLLFSATFSSEILSIAEKITTNPITIKVASTHQISQIRQEFYRVNHSEHRLLALKYLLLENDFPSTVVFCTTKLDTQQVADHLRNEGFHVIAIHGDREQRERDQALAKFSNKSISILVATDVAARGLDIDKLDAVINFQMSRDPEVHVHRIGRTGRAGNKGIAITLVAESEIHRVIKLEDYINQEIEVESLPSSLNSENNISKPPMRTIQIDGGKKQKIRPGDILGALTSKQGDQIISGEKIGKIQIFEQYSYVAVSRKIAQLALSKINNGKLKGRSFKARLVSS